MRGGMGRVLPPSRRARIIGRGGETSMSRLSSATSRAIGDRHHPLVTAPLLGLVAISVVLCILFVRLAEQVRAGEMLPAARSVLRTIDDHTAVVPVAIADGVSL